MADRPLAKPCWCGWTLLRPRFFFASHLDWHLDRVRIRRLLQEALGG